MKVVTSGVFFFTGLIMGRVYLLEGSNGLTLIDTGIGPAAGKVLKQLAAAGHKAQDVKRILITHAHPDHVGGLPKLKEATGAAVYASAPEAQALNGQSAVARRPGGLRPPETIFPATAVENIIADGDLIPEPLGGLQVVATPGHAPGHVAFWQPERRILFCGDIIFRLPRLRLPYKMLTVDMAENIRSIQKAAALEPAIVCFGHGRPLLEDAAVRIRQFAEKVRER